MLMIDSIYPSIHLFIYVDFCVEDTKAGATLDEIYPSLWASNLIKYFPPSPAGDCCPLSNVYFPQQEILSSAWVSR